eukprot:GEMP01005307.1.p1 GENE.GEMP01005307.1~~GEMP01005307.1.p1  ORF type:complete len:794 (+),score=157.67 GEMP01005307.1:300-2681(+)
MLLPLGQCLVGHTEPPIDFCKLTDANVILAIVLPGVIAAFFCCCFCLFLRYMLMKQPTGKDVDLPNLDKIALKIKSGSIAFLKVEYKFLAIFVLVFSIALLILFTVDPVAADTFKTPETDGVRVMGAFLTGAIFSAAAGWLGMLVATDGNVRTTVACYSGSLNDGLRVAFTAGSVMGFTVVGLGLFGVSAMFACLQVDRLLTDAWQLMAGFGFGASSIALFARVAGGIYTKAADVGADLVGKVEAGINEDDPHNPAVIADNVGDNVGDVAGMGADLFESYVGSIIAAATLGASSPVMAYAKVALPLWLATAGVMASIIGFFFVSTKAEGNGWDVKLSTLMRALEKGMFIAVFLFLGLAAVIIYLLFGTVALGWKIYGCVVIGCFAGIAIGKVTEYFTSFDYGPVISIKDRGRTGPATVVIQGMGVGMISTLVPTVILVIAILACATLENVYGIAIAAVGMLATLGITLATDAYGPVADNAGGLAEMCGLGDDVRAKTDSLDALGNTTAATGKGFAIGSAVLTSLSLLAAFKMKVQPLGSKNVNFDITEPVVLSGVLFGAMLPYLFAALTMISVGKAAAEIIEEVRRQFREIPGLRTAIEKASRGEAIPADEDVEPDSDRCVAISTISSVREMIAPGTYAVMSPLIVGFFVGPSALMGMLAGSIASGAMVAIMMSNAGGAWDNSKKLCEKLKIKKTDQGKACIVGDTVGDPFKDTSGPALNILIKLMSMISLTIAPLIQDNKNWDGWYFGFIPFGILLIVTLVLMMMKILTWVDANKLEDKKDENGDQSAEHQI